MTMMPSRARQRQQTAPLSVDFWLRHKTEHLHVTRFIAGDRRLCRSEARQRERHRIGQKMRGHIREANNAASAAIAHARTTITPDSWIASMPPCCSHSSQGARCLIRKQSARRSRSLVTGRRRYHGIMERDEFLSARGITRSSESLRRLPARPERPAPTSTEKW